MSENQPLLLERSDSAATSVPSAAETLVAAYSSGATPAAGHPDTPLGVGQEG